MERSLQILQRMDAKSDAQLQSKLKIMKKSSSKSHLAAANILRREDINGKRSRFECLLVQQYTAKYGTKNPNSQINACIKITVQGYLNGFDEMSDAERNLGSLEDELKDVTEALKRNVIQSRSRGPEVSETSNEVMQPRSNSFSKSQSAKEIKNPNDWVVVNAILAVSDEEKEQKKNRGSSD